jgi:HPt (histidine-containing phosphotransfer) domain-containing protein
LEIYYKDGIEKLITLNDCLEQDNLDLYTIHIHAIKSASANIGAIDLSLMAQTLESAGEQKNWNVIEKRNPEFVAALESLLDRINITLTAYKAEAGIKESSCDMKAVKKELRKLKTALDTLDAGTINKAIDNLREMTQGSSIESSVDKISDNILIGEYEKAVSFIENISLDDK